MDFLKNINIIFIGNGDWGLGIAPNPQSPNPQSPIPNPHTFINYNNKIE